MCRGCFDVALVPRGLAGSIRHGSWWPLIRAVPPPTHQIDRRAVSCFGWQPMQGGNFAPRYLLPRPLVPRGVRRNTGQRTGRPTCTILDKPASAAFQRVRRTLRHTGRVCAGRAVRRNEAPSPSVLDRFPIRLIDRSGPADRPAQTIEVPSGTAGARRARRGRRSRSSRPAADEPGSQIRRPGGS
jgi:hypothetical protein